MPESPSFLLLIPLLFPQCHVVHLAASNLCPTFKLANATSALIKYVQYKEKGVQPTPTAAHMPFFFFKGELKDLPAKLELISLQK